MAQMKCSNARVHAPAEPAGRGRSRGTRCCASLLTGKTLEAGLESALQKCLKQSENGHAVLRVHEEVDSVCVFLDPTARGLDGETGGPYLAAISDQACSKSAGSTRGVVMLACVSRRALRPSLSDFQYRVFVAKDIHRHLSGG